MQPVRLARRIDPGFVDPGYVDPPPEAPDEAQSEADESDNWVWFPMPPVSAALWGYPADPPVLMMVVQPEGPDPGPWPAVPRKWPP
jgi:hypothetical protein